jgi:7-cyano-7-deazaguanine synthase in queuosine biosynthesis
MPKSEIPYAQFTVYWPGQTVHLCDKHLLVALRAAQAIDLKLTYLCYHGTERCAACKKESLQK